MTTIKFDRSVKYQGVRYAAHEAFKVEDSDVEELKKVGATVLSVETVTPPQPEPHGTGEERAMDTADCEGGEEDAAKLKEDLLSYTVAALVQFAEERNIDLQGKTRKADIYNVIVASLE